MLMMVIVRMLLSFKMLTLIVVGSVRQLLRITRHRSNCLMLEVSWREGMVCLLLWTSDEIWIKATIVLVTFLWGGKVRA